MEDSVTASYLMDLMDPAEVRAMRRRIDDAMREAGFDPRLLDHLSPTHVTAMLALVKPNG